MERSLTTQPSTKSMARVYYVNHLVPDLLSHFRTADHFGPFTPNNCRGCCTLSFVVPLASSSRQLAQSSLNWMRYSSIEGEGTLVPGRASRTFTRDMHVHDPRSSHLARRGRDSAVQRCAITGEEEERILVPYKLRGTPCVDLSGLVAYCRTNFSNGALK